MYLLINYDKSEVCWIWGFILFIVKEIFFHFLPLNEQRTTFSEFLIVLKRFQIPNKNKLSSNESI